MITSASPRPSPSDACPLLSRGITTMLAADDPGTTFRSDVAGIVAPFRQTVRWVGAVDAVSVTVATTAPAPCGTPVRPATVTSVVTPLARRPIPPVQFLLSTDRVGGSTWYAPPVGP